MKLKRIDQLVDEVFRYRWRRLEPDSQAISALYRPGLPGVYVLAYPAPGNNLSGKIVRPEDVYYVGMTNSKRGLRGRLKGFLRSANGGTGHSAGIKFLKQHGPYSKTCRRRPLFFVTHEIECCTIKSESTAEDFYEIGNRKYRLP